MCFPPQLRGDLLFAQERNISLRNDMKTTLKSFRVSSVVILTLVVLGVAMWAGISHLHEVERIDFERKKSEWRQKWFGDVKGGKHYATIMDPKIIPMFANDLDCVQNITELHFSMVTIEPTDVPSIEQLVNVRHLMFYDTHGNDAVLDAAKTLPIETVALIWLVLRRRPLKAWPIFGT